MDKEKIISFLEDNGLSEIEELNYDEEMLLLKFYLDFDDEELEAARAYADDECEGEKEGESWYDEFFLPYLNELATDTTGEIIEDLMEEQDVEAQFVSYEVIKEDYSYNEFVAAFYEKGKKIDINQILDNMGEEL